MPNSSNDFLNTFVGTKARENAGSSSANRFDFQKNWALLKLMQLHKDGEDFLMVLEHHEDIVVLDAEENPKTGEFFQIKTKDKGNWTVGTLVAVKNGKSSIVQKMYDNYENFSQGVSQLFFVSNASLSSQKQLLDKASFFDLSVKEKQKVWENLNLSETVCIFDELEKFVFLRTEMTPETHDAFTIGKFSTFLNEKHPSQPICSMEAYRSMFEDIRLKTNVERSTIDPKEFREKKCICKSEFEMFVNRVGATSNLETQWAVASGILSNSGLNPIAVRKLSKYFKEHAMSLFSLSDLKSEKLNQLIEERLVWYEENNIDVPVGEILEQIAAYLKDNFQYVDDYEDAENYFKSAILYNLSVL